MNKILADYCINITDGEHGTVIDDPNGEYYLLSNKNIVSGQIKINSEEDRTINKEWFDKINKRVRLDIEDVLISTVGTIGKVAIVQSPINYTVQRSVGVIKTDKKQLDPYFLAYQLQIPQFQKRLVSLSKGAVQKCLFISDLKTLQISVPPLEEQKVISSVLRNIDLKIQNNKKQIENLESLAKTIYDYWFVQFDFPNEDGKPYKSSGGKMVWDNYIKREIPEGWDVKKIKEIESNIITGKTPSTKDESNFGKDIPFITIGDIRGKSFVTNTEISLSFSGANSQKNKFIPKHSLCVTCIATPGLIGITTKESQTNQQINSINCKYEQNLYYLFFAIKDYFKYSSGAKTGNTFLNMNKEDFSNIELVYNKNVIKQFYETVCGIFNQIEKNELCNQKLCELKDWILPLLMNGQVHV